MKRLLFLLCGLIGSQVVSAQTDPQADTSSHTSTLGFIKDWIEPSGASFQYAGNIGYFSTGPIWNIYKHKVEFSTMVGFIPTRYSRTDHVILTLKLNYNFKTSIRLNETTVLKPFNLSAMSTRFFGEHFNRYRDDSKYEDYYYRWGPYLRLGFSNQIHLSKELDSKWFKSVNVYFDTSMWDLYLNSYFAHENYKSKVMDFGDLITFGIGITTYFK